MSSANRRTFLKASAGAAALALQPDLFAGVPRLAAPISVGLVGTGRQGRAILAELAKFDDVTVAAYADVDERRLRSAARRAPDAKACATHAELLGHPGLDAVIVATPTHLHKDVTCDALAAGKHVYCESPLAHSFEDGRAIVKAARQAAQLVCQIGFQARTDPVYNLARSFVRTGVIEDTLALRAQHHEKMSWRVPSSDPSREKENNWRLDPEVSLGLLGEFGAQQFDVLHWFTGAYPTAARATGAVLAWKDGRAVPDTVHAHLSWPGGITAAWEGTLGNSFEGTHEVVIGKDGAVKLGWTHGWLFKESDAKTYEWEVYATRDQFYSDEGIILIADATKLAAQGKLKEGIGLPHPPLYYALEAFLKSATEGTKNECSAEEGYRATAVAIAADQALKSGGPVTLDESTYEVK
jgi:predicted dehydrogenase